MKILFDTSILVAAMVVDHPNYVQSRPWLQRIHAEEIQGFVSTHISKDGNLKWIQ